MFQRVTNVLGDKISNKNLVYCFFLNTNLKTNLFSLISILSTRHYENIADKVKVNDLHFMIFTVQINKVLRVI